jgi:hypothetical protein
VKRPAAQAGHVRPARRVGEQAQRGVGIGQRDRGIRQPLAVGGRDARRLERRQRPAREAHRRVERRPLLAGRERDAVGAAVRVGVRAGEPLAEQARAAGNERRAVERPQNVWSTQLARRRSSTSRASAGRP